jgi:hypothetical protein
MAPERVEPRSARVKPESACERGSTGSIHRIRCRRRVLDCALSSAVPSTHGTLLVLDLGAALSRRALLVSSTGPSSFVISVRSRECVLHVSRSGPIPSAKVKTTFLITSIRRQRETVPQTAGKAKAGPTTSMGCTNLPSPTPTSI